MCDTLDVSRAGYYAWRSEAESARQRRDRELMPLVADIFWKHRRRYGARRIAVELAAQGQPCGVDRVAKLLKIQGLRAIQPNRSCPRRPTAGTRWATAPTCSSMLRRPTRLNQVWVADITYIPLDNSRFAYLALVMDLFSRRVVGWDLAEQMTETLVLESLAARDPRSAAAAAA